MSGVVYFRRPMDGPDAKVHRAPKDQAGPILTANCCSRSFHISEIELVSGGGSEDSLCDRIPRSLDSPRPWGSQPPPPSSAGWRRPPP